jgi:uncharacterized membrane protein YdjX (TVP38/TMEM64 family)
MKIQSHHRRFIILGLIVLVVIALYFGGVFDFFTFEFFKHHLEEARNFVHDNYALAVAAFIGALTGAVTLCIPLGVLTPLIAGMLFGWLPGASYAIIGATLGATIVFLMSRYLIGEFFQHRFGDRLKAFNHELKQYGYIYLLGLHFFPITPFFILNILAGLTTLSAWTFIWTTIVGVLPSYLIYTYIGNEIREVSELADLLSGKIVIAFLLLKVLSLVTISIGRFGHHAKNYISRKKKS